MATAGQSPLSIENSTGTLRPRGTRSGIVFSAEDQEQMLAEDLAAGTQVSLVLTALIMIGLVLSIVTLAGVLADAVAGD